MDAYGGEGGLATASPPISRMVSDSNIVKIRESLDNVEVQGILT